MYVLGPAAGAPEQPVHARERHVRAVLGYQDGYGNHGVVRTPVAENYHVNAVALDVGKSGRVRFIGHPASTGRFAARAKGNRCGN